MKKILFLVSSFLLSTQINAQLFTDDFESYNTGALCPQSLQWTTWSGTQGGAEDGTVSTTQALSGTKSVYLNSNSANGGPQDILLTLGQQYTSGILTWETAFYIPTGKQAYFNFQANTTPGQIWGLNWNAANGSFTFDDGVSPNLLTSSYPSNTWFTIRIEANLTLGVWEAFVDGNSIGTWINGTNNVASVNYYPHNANAQFYIDDVMFDHEPYTLPNLNAIASSINMNGNIATQNVQPTAIITNGGTTTLNSFTATLNYNGNNYVQNVSAVNVASLANYSVNFENLALVAGSNTATLTISNINGGSDDIIEDNTTSISVNPIVPAPGKMVVGEEGTGTWCGWCPRGSIFMDLFEEDFSDFWIGIAVHNADPMADVVYDAGMGTMISGYPAAVVDRGPSLNPAAMYNDFYARLQVAPVAFISTTQTYNAASRELTVTVSADFQQDANNSFKLACVLTEDNVTGTGSGYNQVNYYAGGSNGPMGGYELLPNPVPASQMVYDHVARAITPSFAGDATSFPAVVNSGETHAKTYTFTLPIAWDASNINIIGMMIDPTGKVDNASKFKLSDLVSVEELSMHQPSFTLYPNPSAFSTTLALELIQPAVVEVAVIDVSGKVIHTRNYGVLTGNQHIEMNTSSLHAGVYIVQVTIDGVLSTQRLVVE